MKLPSASIRQIALCSIAAASALALGACDSKRENAAEQKADNMENKADAVRDSGEKKADAIESKKAVANDDSTDAALENKADATRKAADNKADAIENHADAVRDQSPAPTP